MLIAMIWAAQAPAYAQTWEETLERVVPAVVSIEVSPTRNFDTDSASNAQGTGFVLDAEAGLILTNRHMVHPGPVTAEAIFVNNEEVELQAIYRDPVHDFGLYRFDPEDVRFMELSELELVPEAAEVGAELRVVGNDAGEKLVILSGTLARMDRNAPYYGRNTYNDFNTFYYQAGSSTSGGSSGSPVVNKAGDVIALNAGGMNGSAASYYLPLDRIVRAVELIQAGEPVPRGTLQATFIHTPFDEVRRLGLREATESEVRSADAEETGMLVVQSTVPGGPAASALQPGDVLIRIGGELVTGFVPLEAALDDAVGQPLELEIERGGEEMTLSLTPDDLHAISPSEYLEISNGVLHPLSYQLARNHSIPAGGIYVANTGYMLSNARVPYGAVLREINGEPVADLDDVVAALEALPDGSRVPVRYHPLHDQRAESVAVMTIDRRWFPAQRCVRDDADGSWPCTPLAEPPAAEPQRPATTAFTAAGPRPVRALAASMVIVDFDIPYRVEGVSGTHFAGAGVIVDAERGFVLVDRDTVPIGLGDATLTFAGSVRIPGEITYIHPTHNFAILSYDTALLGDTPVESAELWSEPVEPGDRLWQVSVNSRHEVVHRETSALRIEALYLGQPSPPQFRDYNVEGIDTAEYVPSVGGVLADRKGRVLALWASFARFNGGDRSSYFRGLPAEVIAPTLEALQENRAPNFRSLGVHLSALLLADARERGLSEAQAAALEAHDPDRRQVLSIGRVDARSPAYGLLESGDMILAINGTPVTRFLELERASQSDTLSLTVLRDGEEQTLTVPTLELPGRGVDRAVVWAGVVLHEPHIEISSQRGLVPEGVYTSWYWYGSPAARYGLRPTRRIVEVDGQPTPDLDAFLAAVADKEDHASVRIKLVDLDGGIRVYTLKLDLDYWPTRELVWTEDGGWVRYER